MPRVDSALYVRIGGGFVFGMKTARNGGSLSI